MCTGILKEWVVLVFLTKLIVSGLKADDTILKLGMYSIHRIKARGLPVLIMETSDNFVHLKMDYPE